MTLPLSFIEDLKLASSKMTGEKRRSFQAEMAIKYCSRSARKAENVFGWNRDSAQLGLHEKKSGIVCLSAHKGKCGRKLWEEQYPDAASVLFAIAESYCQQNRDFSKSGNFTRLTATEAINQLEKAGLSGNAVPSPSSTANILNRNGYRLRPVVKVKPQKKNSRDRRYLVLLKFEWVKG